MKKVEMSAMEKEMANFDFGTLQAHAEKAQSNIAAAKSAADVKSEICSVWSKIGKYVKMAEVIPIVGKYITIIANLLDSLCAS